MNIGNTQKTEHQILSKNILEIRPRKPYSDLKILFRHAVKRLPRMPYVVKKQTIID